MMRVLLTGMCCGKTTLERSGGKYVDLDIFAGVKTRRQRTIARRMVEIYAQDCAESGKVYLMNIDRFDKWALQLSPHIKVTGIAVPGESAFEGMERLFRERDMEELGSVRARTYLDFCTRLRSNIELAQRLSGELSCPLHFLKKGEFIDDYIHG